MPSQARSAPSIAVDAVLARVGERELGARPEQRPLHVERRGREQVAVRHVLVRLAVPLDGGHHRHDAVARDRRGADGVGHARDDLEAGPQAGGARAGERVQAEVEHLLHVAGIEDRHVEACEQRLGRARDRRRLAAGVVADDRRARRPCARRRRSCRGGASRPRGRGRAPCRTTWPARRRTSSRAAGRPAGCPTPRWRRAPRSGRARAGRGGPRRARGCGRAPCRARRAASPGSPRSSCR